MRKNDIKTHVKDTLNNKKAAAKNPWLEFKKTIKKEDISNIVTYEPNGVKYVVIGKGGIVAKASDSEYSQDEKQNRKALQKAKQAKAPKPAPPKKNKKAATKQAAKTVQQPVPMATRRSARFIRS